MHKKKLQFSFNWPDENSIADYRMHAWTMISGNYHIEKQHKVMKRVRLRRVRIQGYETCPIPPSPNTRSWNVSDSAESKYKVMKRVRLRRVRIQGHETCPTPPSLNTRSWNMSDSAESEYKVMKRVWPRRVRIIFFLPNVEKML